MTGESDRETKKKILLKITGEIFIDRQSRQFSSAALNALIAQIKPLLATHQFGIVVGGGNFFRGSQQGKQLGLDPAIAHQIGMLATISNGLILSDLFTKSGIPTALLSALAIPGIGEPICPTTISRALAHDHVIIFTGGTGNPFFTTDTTAIVRALQLGAHEVWKGTMVDGIYTADPRKDPLAKKLATIDYQTALQKNLAIMDLTAYAMAQEHSMPIRIFDIFADHALMHAAHNPHFGSTIIKEHNGITY